MIQGGLGRPPPPLKKTFVAHSQPSALLFFCFAFDLLKIEVRSSEKVRLLSRFCKHPWLHLVLHCRSYIFPNMLVSKSQIPQNRLLFCPL